MIAASQTLGPTFGGSPSDRDEADAAIAFAGYMRSPLGMAEMVLAALLGVLAGWAAVSVTIPGGQTAINPALFGLVFVAVGVPIRYRRAAKLDSVARSSSKDLPPR